MTFKKKTIYLAGPIAGLTHDEAAYGWRQVFSEGLIAAGLDHISCSSPMRGKTFLKSAGVLTSTGDKYNANPLSSAAGITTRDYNDVRTCDLMVACYLESHGKLSLGTGVEYGYCWALQIPVIAVGPADEPNISHLMIQRMTGYRVDTLEEAAHIAGLLLTPGI